MADASDPLAGFDLSALFDSAQQLMSAQAAAAAQEVTGSSGGGKVTIVATGGGEFRRVTMAQDVLDLGDVSLLEDLVLAALHDVTAQVQAAQGQAMGGLDMGALGGLGGMLGGPTEAGD